MKKIAIKGSLDSSEQKEIIEILESLGGINKYHYFGNSTSSYYYIDCDNTIMLNQIICSIKYELLTIKQYKEKYMNKENNKELQIIAPEGYEVDKEKSTFEKIVFKKVEEKLTYRKITNKLFNHKFYYYTDAFGNIKKADTTRDILHNTNPNDAPTEYQLKILLALNKLMNVAYYLNDGWKPDWNNDVQGKYYIYITIIKAKLFK